MECVFGPGAGTRQQKKGGGERRRGGIGRVSELRASRREAEETGGLLEESMHHKIARRRAESWESKSPRA